MKINNAIFFILIIAIILFVAYHFYFKQRYKIYELPTTNSDPQFWGPKYWFALHDIVGRIPCPACHDKAVSFMSFFHDYINKSLEKKLYNEQNFNEWTTKICSGNNISTETSTGSVIETERKFY